MADSDNTDSNKDIPPWLQPVPDTEEEGSTLSSMMSGRGAKITMVVGALVVVVVFVAAIAFLYPEAQQEGPRHIAADTAPIREKPEEEGGMQVAHQDKSVLEIGDGAPATPSVRIGSQPEQPVDEIPDLPEETTSVAEERQDTIGDIAEAVVEEDQPAEVQEPAPEATEPAPVKGEEVAEEPAGTHAVQLGAYGSEQSAQTAWRAIRGRFLGELRDLSPEYVPVQSGDRTLYRLRVGMLPDRASADAVCIALRAQQQACFVVNP